MKKTQANYKKYGKGKNLLISFHGYGMDGGQFEAFKNSFCEQYLIIGFYLPYHQNGPENHSQWIQMVRVTITDLLKEHQLEKFSLAGYSIGSKIALSITEEFSDKIEELILFAPYGVDNHWGLTFVTKGFGNWFFKKVVNSSIPAWIMKISTSVNIIDVAHNAIIQKELSNTQKRKSLCSSLSMVGEINLKLEKIIKEINDKQISVRLIYGINDVIFPYNKRNLLFIKMVNLCEVLSVNAGHWMITEELDLLLVKNTSPA